MIIMGTGLNFLVKGDSPVDVKKNGTVVSIFSQVQYWTTASKTAKLELNVLFLLLWTRVEEIGGYSNPSVEVAASTGLF